MACFILDKQIIRIMKERGYRLIICKLQRDFIIASDWRGNRPVIHNDGRCARAKRELCSLRSRVKAVRLDQ